MCKGTFGLRMGFRGNECAKRLLGKIGVLGEMGMQRNISNSVKDEVLGENGCAKRLLGKIGVLGEMGVQRNISGENGHAKGLLS